MNKTDYKTIIKILDEVHIAAEDLEHTKIPNKRFGDKIKARLPNYTVSFSKEYGFYNLKIWGYDLDYNNAVHLCWHENNNNWEYIKAQIDVANPSDYLERLEDEKKIIPKLHIIQMHIEELMDEANYLVRNLPIPKSATVRAEGHFWNTPSYELREMFPYIWSK